MKAVDGVSFSIRRGEILGIVGESGSGKTATCYAIMGLPTGADVGHESVRPCSTARTSSLRAQAGRGDRGKRAMIFQDPMTSLNPVLQVADS